MPEISENTPQSSPNPDVFFSWETWESPPVVRNARWYTVAALVGIFLLFYGLFTANFLFAIIVILFAVLTMVRDVRPSQKIQAAITKDGFLLDQAVYPFNAIRDFSIVYQPPEVRNLYITFKGKLRPPLSVGLEDADPNMVRNSLLPFILENLERDQESLTDRLRRVYHL